LCQTLRDIDIVIGDNASTDDTPQIAREYAARDPRVRYIRHPRNLGASGNFNALFHSSNARYFKWAAYDDVMEPTYLQRCVEALEADPSLVGCHSFTWRIDGEGRRLGMHAPPDAWHSERPADRFAVHVRGQEFKPIWAVMRSDVIRRTSLHPPIAWGDQPFLAEMVLMGRFATIPQPLMGVREHQTAYTSGHYSTQEEWEWWGRPRLHWKQLTTPLMYVRQAAIVARADLPWEQKVICWRHLSACAAEFCGSVARRNAVRVMNKTHLFRHLPRSGNAAATPEGKTHAHA
jgi:glycosyltransferase involved in cell wall biosynthesis